MSYTVKVTSVKPDGVRWFSDVNPESFQSYKAWAATIAGTVSVKKERPDENTLVRTYVFENEETYTNFLNENRANVDNLLRQDYNMANGISFVLEVVSV